jgi:general secretion pathway protein A
MYMNFYRFREGPFGITPDPRFLFLSASHREALATMVYGCTQRKGFMSVIGEVGTGKTIVLRAFLERLDRSKTTAICLLNPLATFEQIVEEILPPDFQGSTPDRFRSLQEWLISEYREGRNVVVAIDEAQRMSVTTLERLRLLSNLETAEHKLIQIILVGQPELERKLQQKNLRQLWQRIAVRATIWPLNRADSIAYVLHRLSKATAGSNEHVFTRAALRHLVRRGSGTPRRLNILCDRALIAGFSYQKRPVPLTVAWEASSESARQPRWRRTVLRNSWVLVTTIALVATASYVLTNRSKDTPESVAQVQTQSIVDSSEKLASYSVAPPETLVDPEETHAPVEATAAPILVDVGTVPTDVPMGQIVAWPESEAANVETRVVGQGDGIWQMCRTVYGTVDASVVRVVLDLNPHIEDPNKLTIGDTLVFPSMAMTRHD